MIEMYETLSGGDYCVGDSGILLDNSLNTVVYLALYGGNYLAVTEIDRKPPGAYYQDYWGNCSVLNDSTEQFNSEFERTVAENPINSGNLIKYESAAETDTEFLVENGYAESVEAVASIITTGKLRIDITINQLSSSEPESISFVWDETLQKLEIINV